MGGAPDVEETPAPAAALGEEHAEGRPPLPPPHPVTISRTTVQCRNTFVTTEHVRPSAAGDVAAPPTGQSEEAAAAHDKAPVAAEAAPPPPAEAPAEAPAPLEEAEVPAAVTPTATTRDT